MHASFCCWSSVVWWLLVEDCCFIILNEDKTDIVINLKWRKQYIVLFPFFFEVCLFFHFGLGLLYVVQLYEDLFFFYNKTHQTSHVKLLMVF